MKITRPLGFSNNIRCIQIESRFGVHLFIQPHNVAYGHAISDIVMSTTIAENLNGKVILLPHSKNPNRALLDMKSKKVPIYKSPRWVAIIIAFFFWEIPLFISPYKIKGVIWTRDRLGRFAKKLKNNKAVPKFISIRVSQLARDLKANYSELKKKPTSKNLYLKRKLISNPSPLYLDSKWHKKCQKICDEIGLKNFDKIAIVHIRESGYKLNTVNNNPKASTYEDRSLLRNIDVDLYIPAIKNLLSKDYTIIRIGDKSMTPLKMDGLIDLATSPKKIPALELYIMQFAKLFFLSESGPMYTPLLFNDVPCLLSNVTTPYSSYPIRKNERFLPQKITTPDGELLPAEAMLTDDYQRYKFEPDHYRFIPNNSEMLVEALNEVIELSDNNNSPSANQLEYLENVKSMHKTVTPALCPPKWSDEDGFWGKGFISDCYFKDKYCDINYLKESSAPTS